MLGAAGPHQPTVHRHHLVGDDVVAGQAVLPGQPAHAAARVSPPTPVRETLLVVVASPCRCAPLSNPRSRAAQIALTTSPAVAQRAMIRGRRSTIAFHTARAWS